MILEDGRTAYDHLQSLSRQPRAGGPMMQQALERLVQTARYRRAPHGRIAENSSKEWMLASVVTAYRQGARAELQRTSAAYRKARAAAASRVLHAMAAGAKDVKVEAARAGAGEVNKLLKAYKLQLPVPDSVPTK
jgi:hypothetical protein